MKRAAIVLMALLAGAFFGATALYAVSCTMFAIFEPGLEGRASRWIRNGLIASASLGAVGLLFRLLGSAPKVLRIIIRSFILPAAVLLLFVYAFPCRRSMQTERWAQLRALADHLAARRGSAVLNLPGPEWSYRVIARRGRGTRTIEIALNDPWSGRIFGIDLMQLDYVLVNTAPDGTIRNVTVSYF